MTERDGVASGSDLRLMKETFIAQFTTILHIRVMGCELSSKGFMLVMKLLVLVVAKRHTLMNGLSIQSLTLDLQTECWLLVFHGLTAL